MHVLLVADVLLVEIVHVHLLLAVRSFEELQKVAFELVGVFVDVFFGILADLEHPAHVGFGHGVLLEAVFVAALFGADLAVPAQALQAFGFHLVGDIFRAAHFGFGHGWWMVSGE